MVLSHGGETCYNKSDSSIRRLPVTKTEELFDEAISLPVEARAQLVDKLLQSLNPTQTDIDKLWAREAEKRVDDIKKGKVKTVPGEQVFKKIRDRLGS
jgi:putative addiction module component (TIGR02574 family)